MRTPDEIKLGLAACSADECHGAHAGCPYKGSFYCVQHLCGDTMLYILQLERERDALRADLEKVCETVNTCLVCDHYRTDWQKPGCELIGLTCKWEWRGIKE